MSSLLPPGRWPTSILAPALFVFVGLASGAAHAVQDCELNGESINTANGNTTRGKTGLIRCKDRDSGQMVREQEIRDGKFMGLVRHYKDGKPSKEYSVNETGNMNGRSREFAANGQAVFDGVYENGSRVGLVRGFFESGKPMRATFYEEGREKASAEWNEAGQLQDLRCADQPVLAPALDDRRVCGFSGPSQVELFSGRGELQSRATYTEGKRTRYETYYRNGKSQQQQELSATQRIERRFSDDGTKRREIQWAAVGTPARFYKVLEQEFSERGGLVREQRWAGEGTPVSDVGYYLNGQPREKSVYLKEGGLDLRVDSRYFDSGKLASEGRYTVKPRTRQEQPIGSHKRFDEQGRVVSESVYDDKGRVSREKAWDEAGQLVRDDEVFEDGSRKAFAR